MIYAPLFPPFFKKFCKKNKRGERGGGLNGRKIILPELINYLTPMSLAFLIMDDGGWVAGSKSVRISTNNFMPPFPPLYVGGGRKGGQEVELLRQMFKTKFG
jgi:hypothetical protein